MCKPQRNSKKKGGSGEWNKWTDWSAEVLAFATTVMLKSSISPTQTNTESLLFKWSLNGSLRDSVAIQICLEGVHFTYYVTGQIWFQVNFDLTQVDS